MSTSTNQPYSRDDNTTTRVDNPVVGRGGVDRRDVVARQKEEFGGMKFGSGFFGWLAATGMAVLLTALVAAAITALGLAQKVNLESPTTSDVHTAGLVSGIVLLVIIFIAYFCGGFVAGRMARFNGVKQGIAVWLWAIIVAVVVAIVSAIGGTNATVMANLNAVPRIPVSSQTLTTAGIVTALAVAVVSLVAAVLGGLAGMRFHRRVDKSGLGS